MEPVVKPWMSKTIWLNALMAVAGGVSLLVPPLHVVGDFLTANAGVIATVWGVVGVALRFITHGRIGLVD